MCADQGRAGQKRGEIIRSRHKPALRWTTFSATIGLFTLFATLVGCRDTGAQLDELRAMPEAALVYPGAEEVNSGGGEGHMTLDGPQTSFTWRWLGTEASYDEVEGFYAEELASRGWSDGGGSSGIRTTGEFSARAWHKDDVVFRLAFPDPEQHANQEPSRDTRRSTTPG